MMRPDRLVILGPQGSGKGTQAELLAARLGARHIASGDLIRAEIRAGTDRGRALATIAAGGQLVPDSVVLDLIGESLAAAPKWILDGFPRTLAQAQELDAFLDARQEPIDTVIALEAPDAVLIERIGGRVESQSTGLDYHTVYNPPPPTDPGPFLRRPDDTPEAVAHRLAIYHAETEPLEAEYGRRGILVRVDASSSIPEVQRAIFARLDLSVHGDSQEGGARG